MHWRAAGASGIAREAARLTYRQSRSSTLSVATMVVMAVVMADTGMTVLLAKGIASVSGPLFPLVSPFIGLLGSFMSGSNTNSNVMFGLLQMETARALGIGAVTISSIQSIGASVGSSMAPAKVLVGRGSGWTRRRGAEHLPYGDPVRDRAGPAYRPGSDDNRPPAAGAFQVAKPKRNSSRMRGACGRRP